MSFYWLLLRTLLYPERPKELGLYLFYTFSWVSHDCFSTVYNKNGFKAGIEFMESPCQSSTPKQQASSSPTPGGVLEFSNKVEY